MSEATPGAARPAAPFASPPGKETAAAATAAVCPECGTELARTLLACPSCGALTRSAELAELAAAAESAELAGDLAAAAAAWREALALLPRSAPQELVVVARLDALTHRIDAASALARPAGGQPRSGSPLARLWGGAGAVVLILLTKGKLLLLGLTKASTLFSMLAFLGVYWKLYGWSLAAGVVLSIYIHEMGHVAALARYGIRATAPMFVPGLGAFVAHRGVVTAREDARIGLAGPLWGLGAAVVAYALYVLTGLGVWGAIAQLGALLNLANLAPVWQLDGARGFRALARPQQWVATAVMAIAALVTWQGILLIVAAVCAYAAYRATDRVGDSRAFATFLALVVGLTAVLVLTAPVAATAAAR